MKLLSYYRLNLEPKIMSLDIREEINNIIILGSLLEYKLEFVDFGDQISIGFKSRDGKFIYKTIFYSDEKLENLINLENIERLKKEL